MGKATDDLEPLRIRSIVVPLDGSEFAEHALPWAIAIAARTRAKLRLVLAHQLPSPPPLDETSGRLYARVELATRTSQRDYLRRQTARIKAEHQVQAVSATIDGAPAEALERYLDEIGADLVVMTTHGRGGLERAWLGSVADRLVRSLDIPVLLVQGGGATRVR
jgi:nucleotide-binding universal stress UspA family protein